ncbi:hypothetical protein ACA135_04710 [Methanobrevibacter acididurans]|uniref:hypothetical protein n=1 Tax=Methanobrevibacter acididurans TaxID=120963 RepID=UPI0038FC1381
MCKYNNHHKHNVHDCLFFNNPNTNTNTVGIVNNSTNVTSISTEDNTNSNDNSYLNNPLYTDFNKDDLNGDGRISFEEELSNIAHTPRDAAYEMFTQADSNGEGLLKGQEYINCREALQNSPYTASH